MKPRALGAAFLAGTAALAALAGLAPAGRQGTTGVARHPARPVLAAVTDDHSSAAQAATTSPATSAAAATAGAGMPEAARQRVGGPLMASQGVVVQYPPRHSAPLPRVPASAYVIANANTGQVLAAKDPHGLFGPASTLKVLTAITLIPRLRPDEDVTVTRRAATVEPTDVGLKAGRKYKISDLFSALLLISANDAAMALTQATGSLARGMALINAEAHHLQAYDVVARQPNGLPANGQVVSAYDEALIARQALSMPAFMKYDSAVTARFPVKPDKQETLVNQNSLLTHYRGGIGGKIGWTVSSEATYIGMARRDGVTLIVTLLHCTALKEISSGERLLNWGFAMSGKVKPVGTLVPPLRTVGDSQQPKPAHAAGARAAHSPGARSADPAGSSAGGGPSLGLAIGIGAAGAALIAAAGLARARARPSHGKHRSG
jgi:D-alanyl-D-alanine carboxypeptidase (penicillin-binding protein 5/6)